MGNEVKNQLKSQRERNYLEENNHHERRGRGREVEVGRGR